MILFLAVWLCLPEACETDNPLVHLAALWRSYI